MLVSVSYKYMFLKFKKDFTFDWNIYITVPIEMVLRPFRNYLWIS